MFTFLCIRCGVTLFVILVIICTWINNSTLKSPRIMMEMSLNYNFCQLTQKAPETQKQYISLFDGIRFINTFWITFAHTFLYVLIAFNFFTPLGKSISA